MNWPAAPACVIWRSRSRTSSPRPAIGGTLSSSARALGVTPAGDSAEPVQAAEESFRVFRQLVEGELPAVEAAAHVLLQDPERRRQGPPRARRPAADRR